MKTGKLDPLLLDVMDIELKVPYIDCPRKNQILFTYQAVNFKKMIDETLKKENVTDSKKERLMQLNSEISENDNPIIITGTWK